MADLETRSQAAQGARANTVTAPVLRPGRENWDRFVALCDDAQEPTYERWIARFETKMSQARRAGYEPLFLDFDPDEMAAWCRLNFGRVDTKARAGYAAFLYTQR